MQATTFVARTANPSLLTALLLAVSLNGMLPHSALAEPNAYKFAPIAFLGDPAPGGGNFTFDFEPASINNRGQASFGADLTTGGEAVFVATRGHISLIARSGDVAPGGGTLSFSGFLGSSSINDAGDTVFAFTLEPFMLPLGMNAGLYRFSHSTKNVKPVVVPRVTAVPGGGVFEGVLFSPQQNDRGDIAFTGIFQGADLAPGPTGVNGSGLGSGVFVVDKHGHIFNVVKPGDEAPGGATFDLAAIASINDLGDVAFGAHLAGEECLMIVPQEVRISCVSGTYLKKAATGKIETIARQGDPMPGGGTCRGTRGRVLNNRGQVAFLCDMTPEPDLDQIGGLFFRSEGTSHAIARPGDPMPGGGKIVTTGPADTFHLSNSGDVTFNARLDTGEHGLYVASRGSVRLVARTGTVIPGVGTIVELVPPDLVGTGSVPSPTGANERGQILFTAAVNDGSGALRGVILLATRADD